MTDVERSTPLAGLVSTQAEETYQRLRLTGALLAGTAPGELDPEAPATEELLDLGIAFRCGPDQRVIRPVDPPAALRLAIAARQHDMISCQSRILAGWSRLSQLLPSSVEGGGKTDGVRVLTRMADIVSRTAELYAAPRNRLRAAETGASPTRPSGDRNPPPARPGVRRQAIYDIDYGRTAGAGVLDRAATAGVEVRLRHRLPLKLVHVDDTVALVTLGQDAVLAQEPALVAMLAEWFDLLWDHPTTMRHPVGGAESSLTPVQREVLTLMLASDDETIARRLELSVSTVRRHVKAIYRALGVNSRFAAGLAAAKLNWL